MDTTLPKFKILNEQDEKEVLSDFPSNHGWVVVNEKYFLPANYVEESSVYYNFNVKPDDIWIVTFPRSGTTLTSEMMWLLCNDMNFEVAKSVPLLQRFPFLDLQMGINANPKRRVSKANEDHAEILPKINFKSPSEIADSTASPRLIKTHLSLSLMPNILKSKCKVVYVARNPKDAAVSYYHFQQKQFPYFQGNFEKYWHYFQNNRVMWGSYWEHLKEAWAQRSNPNFLFLFYEDMIKDLPSTIRKMAQFFEKSYSDEQYEELERHLQFSTFQNNKMINKQINLSTENFFIRQGKSQAWQDMFTPELNTLANQWIEENLHNTDIKFPHVDIYA